MKSARAVGSKRLAVLISNGGTGTNLQAIIDATKSGKVKAKIVIVVSSHSDSQGLLRAKKHKLKTLVVNQDDDLVKILSTSKIDYVCLAGYKRIIPDELIDAFEDKILNVHPGLIPDKLDGVVKCPDGSQGQWNRGKFTTAAVQNFFDTKATYAGSSVNFLSHEFDFGKVICRGFEKIRKGDNVDSLYERLKKKEHKLYVKALQKLCN